MLHAALVHPAWPRSSDDGQGLKALDSYRHVTRHGGKVLAVPLGCWVGHATIW
jgi:hypothetical protein